MPDKPSKVEKKMSDLTGQSTILLNKLLKRLGTTGLLSAGYEEHQKQAKDDKSNRAIFQDISRSVITGYSKPGSKSVTGPFDFFEKYMKRADEEDKEGIAPKKMPPWYKKLIGPALLILGGLAAFVTGIMTDGPLKGFLKLLSQGGIMGGLKWMANILTSVVSKSIGALTKVFGSEAVAKVLGSGKQLVTKIMLPFKRFFISTVPKFIGKLVGPLVKIVGGSAGGVTKMLAKVGVFVAKNLKFIPLLGGLISFGFAISRYRKGDVIGGTIDLVSGVLGMVPIGPWSAVTIPLSIGLSVLNAFLDAKTGGATGKQTMAKGDLLKKWGAKLLGFIYRLPPMSTVYHIAQGITQGLSGNWKAAANHFMYSIPFVGAVLDWFNIGGFKNPEGEPVKGSPTKFWSKVIDFVTKIPPIQTVFALGKMLNAVFQGQWSQAARFAMYSLPGVGMVLDWFNVGSGWGLPKGEEVKGDKKGFWSSIWNFVTKLPPISNVIHLAKGISNIFKGNFATAGKHMMRSIPIIGNLISWFGGDVEAPEEAESTGTKTGFFSKVKGAFLSNFKKIWAKMPKWAKWVAKKLPFMGALLKQLDASDAQSVQDVDTAATNEIGKAVSQGYDDVKKAGNSLWGNITGGFSRAKELAKLGLSNVSGAAGKLWGGIKDGFSNQWEKTKERLGKVGETAGKLWTGIKDGFSNQWEKTKERWSKVGETASNLWNGIKDGFSDEWEKTKERLGKIGEVASNLWNGIKDGFSSQWEKTKERWSKVGEAASNLWEGIKGGFSNQLQKAKEGFTKVTERASAMWGNVKSGFSKIGSAASAAANGLASAAGDAWEGAKKGLADVWKGAKNIGSAIAGKLGLDGQPKQSPLLTAALKQITYQRNTWLRLKKIHLSITASHREIKDILWIAINRTPGTQITIARNHLRVAEMMSSNIAAIYNLLEMSVFPNAEHRGTLIGGTRAAQMQRDMAVEQDSSNLTNSVSLQKDMLMELRDGSIYREMASMNKNVSAKLDEIVQNTLNQGGGFPIPLASRRGATASQSLAHFEKSMNRQTT